jgi:hypothetical protein
MEVSELLRRMGPEGAGGLIARLGRFRFVFPLASSGYCAVHWLIAHSFSFYILSGALVFGAIAGVAVAWLSDWFSAPSSM